MATTEPVTEPTTFSEQIRAATWDAHGDAEHAPYVQDLLGGRLDRLDYARLVAQHWFVYTALEAAVAANTDPAATPFLDPALARVPALERDLASLLGARWRTQVTAVPATAAYCERISRAAAEWSGGLIAHHYVRYLGDLSGGQIIGRVLDRVFGFEDHEGTSFYVFEDLGSPARCKERYRESLDAAAWDVEERARIVDEILVAYACNTRLLEDLSPTT